MADIEMKDSREPSMAPSEGDTVDEQVDDRTLPLDEIKAEIQTPLAPGAEDVTPTPSRTQRRGQKSATTRKPRPKKGHLSWIHEAPDTNAGTEDEGSVISASNSRVKNGETPDTESKTVGTAVGTRRQANGTVGTVFSGSKIRHIKKPDGTPLWRKEIQYEFLYLVIEDATPAFTKVSDGQKGCTFADIYVDCMARSSKTSKILKDRLQIDQQAAHNMAMICLLVNVGRMNTTLNFFPEMRAQLRTYHSIPSLQAYKSQRDYKSLQDAPRLKSILKGASEDEDQPRTIPALKTAPVPRTNPVNLIFVLSQYAPKISEDHFTDKVDFFDLAMRPTISSKSRARAWLWLMWLYLESNFTKEDALNNPFGPGQYKEDQDPSDPNEVPLVVPQLEIISEEEAEAENVDNEEEQQFAERMTKERQRILLEGDEASTPKPGGGDPLPPDNKALKRLRKSGISTIEDDMYSDADSRASPGLGRSPAPDGSIGTALGGQAESLEDDWEAVEAHPGRGRYKRVRGHNTPSRSRTKAVDPVIGSKSRSLLRTATDRGTPDTTGARQTPPILPPGSGHTVLSKFSSHRPRDDLDLLRSAGGLDISTSNIPKSRARTAYQRELEERKQRRIEWQLTKMRKESMKLLQRQRESVGWLLKAARRISELPATFDSEDEDDTLGLAVGGITGKRVESDVVDPEKPTPVGWEKEDYGEEAQAWARVLSRTKRRLHVWSGERDVAVYQARLQLERRHELGRGYELERGHELERGLSDRGMPLERYHELDRHVELDEIDDLAVVEDGLPLPPAPPRSRERKRKARRPERKSNAAHARAPRESEPYPRDLNDEITQDLLAERSDEDQDRDQEMDDEDLGEGGNSDVDML